MSEDLHTNEKENSVSSPVTYRMNDTEGCDFNLHLSMSEELTANDLSQSANNLMSPHRKRLIDDLVDLTTASSKAGNSFDISCLENSLSQSKSKKVFKKKKASRMSQKLLSISFSDDDLNDELSGEIGKCDSNASKLDCSSSDILEVETVNSVKIVPHIVKNNMLALRMESTPKSKYRMNRTYNGLQMSPVLKDKVECKNQNHSLTDNKLIHQVVRNNRGFPVNDIQNKQTNLDDLDKVKTGVKRSAPSSSSSSDDTLQGKGKDICSILCCFSNRKI
jgi:hypothetical protein